MRRFIVALVMLVAWGCLSPTMAANWQGAENPWYRQQKLTPQTMKILGANFDSCCDMGDACQDCIVHRVSDKPPWQDGWWYKKDGAWRQLPPHIVDYVPWTPTGKPVLFLFPYDTNPDIPKGTPVCLKVPGGSS